jgi:dihydrolipoamide dehydrogenase
MVVGEMIYETDLVVLGGGPGGYTAAIHAADLGKDVVLVESREKMGGVCLIEGCIPSKTLIHAVNTARSIKESKKMGILSEGVGFDVEKLRSFIEETVDSLSGGVSKLLENREVDVVKGHARFTGNNEIYVDSENTIIKFKNAIIATGSRIADFPLNPEGSLWDSKKALQIPEIPETLLVIGGGYIGLEIGQAYAGLGSKVTLVEFLPGLLQGADKDLVKVVYKECEKQFDGIYTNSKVTKIEGLPGKYQVEIETPELTIEQSFDKIFYATGRVPNTDDIGLDNVGIETYENGLIETDDTCRTIVKNIFAIGDVTDGPALAHKASREGKVAAEAIAGLPSSFDNVAVPAVLFTNPEIAWTGLTEDEAKSKNIEVNVGRFPLTALGRAKSSDKTKGFVKIISHPGTDLILGAAMVCEHASEMIAECTLAIEMGATLEDLIVTIHPHPTFSEAIMEAAEMVKDGSVHMFRKNK